MVMVILFDVYSVSKYASCVRYTKQCTQLKIDFQRAGLFKRFSLPFIYEYYDADIHTRTHKTFILENVEILSMPIECLWTMEQRVFSNWNYNYKCSICCDHSKKPLFELLEYAHTLKVHTKLVIFSTFWFFLCAH